MPRGPSTGARRRPGRPSLAPADQRERLIEATGRLLRSNTVVSISVKEIVGEAGMSSRSFYDHFRSKDEVLIELVERASLRSCPRSPRSWPRPREHRRFSRCPASPVHRDPGAGRGPRPHAPRDVTRERIEAYRRDGLRRLLDLLMLRLDQLHEAGTVAKRPDRAAVELVLLGIEAMTLRYGREGRIQDLGEIIPGVLGIAGGMIGQTFESEA